MPTLNGSEEDLFLREMNQKETNLFANTGARILSTIGGSDADIAKLAGLFVVMTFVANIRRISNIVNLILNKIEQYGLESEAKGLLFDEHDRVGCINVAQSCVSYEEIEQIANRMNIPIAYDKEKELAYIHPKFQQQLVKELDIAYQNNEIGLNNEIEYNSKYGTREKISKRNIYKELADLSEKEIDVKKYSLGYLFPIKESDGRLLSRSPEEELDILNRLNVGYTFVPNSDEKIIYTNPEQIRLLQKEYEKSFYQRFALEDNGFFEKNNLLKELYNINPKATAIIDENEPDVIYIAPSFVSLLKEKYIDWEQNQFQEHPFNFKANEIALVRAFCVENNISFQRDGLKFSFKSKDFNTINRFIGLMLEKQQEDAFENEMTRDRDKESESETEESNQEENEKNEKENDDLNPDFIEIFDEEDEAPKKEKKTSSKKQEQLNESSNNQNSDSYDQKDSYNQNKDNLSNYDYNRPFNDDNSFTKEQITSDIQNHAMESYFEQAVNITGMSNETYDSSFSQPQNTNSFFESTSDVNENENHNDNSSSKDKDFETNTNKEKTKEETTTKYETNNETDSSTPLSNFQNENLNPGGIYVSKEDFDKAIASQVIKFEDGSSYYVSNGEVINAETNTKEDMSSYKSTSSETNYSDFIKDHGGVSSFSYQSVMSSMASQTHQYISSYNSNTNQSYQYRANTANPYSNYKNSTQSSNDYKELLQKVQENNDRMNNANNRGNTNQGYSGYQGSFISNHGETSGNPYSSIMASMDYSASKTKSDYQMRYGSAIGIGRTGSSLSKELFSKSALLGKQSISSNYASSTLASPSPLLYAATGVAMVKNTPGQVVSLFSTELARTAGSSKFYNNMAQIHSFNRSLKRMSIDMADTSNLSTSLFKTGEAIDKNFTFKCNGKNVSIQALKNSDINSNNINQYISLVRNLKLEKKKLLKSLQNTSNPDEMDIIKQKLEAIDNLGDLDAIEKSLLTLQSKGGKITQDMIANNYYSRQLKKMGILERNMEFDINNPEHLKLIQKANLDSVGDILIKFTSNSAVGDFTYDIINPIKKARKYYHNTKRALIKSKKLLADLKERTRILKQITKNNLDKLKRLKDINVKQVLKNTADRTKIIAKNVRKISPKKTLKNAKDSMKRIAMNRKKNRIPFKERMGNASQFLKGGLTGFVNNLNPIYQWQMKIESAKKALLLLSKGLPIFFAGFGIFSLFTFVIFIIISISMLTINCEPNYVKANYLKLIRLETYIYDPYLLGVVENGENSSLDSLFSNSSYLGGDYPIVFEINTDNGLYTDVRGYLRIKNKTKQDWSGLESEEYSIYESPYPIAGTDDTGKYINGYQHYDVDGNYTGSSEKLREWYSHEIRHSNGNYGMDTDMGMYDGVTVVAVKPNNMTTKTGISSNILSIISMSAYVFQQDFESEGKTNYIYKELHNNNNAPEGYMWVAIDVDSSIPDYSSPIKEIETGTNNELTDGLTDDEKKEMSDISDGVNSGNSSKKTIYCLVKIDDSDITYAQLQNALLVAYKHYDGKDLKDVNKSLKKNDLTKGMEMLDMDDIYDLYNNENTDEYIIQQMQDRQTNISDYMIQMYGASHQINVSFVTDSYCEIETIGTDSGLQASVDTKSDAVELFKLHGTSHDGEGNSVLGKDIYGEDCKHPMTDKLNHKGLLNAIQHEGYINEHSKTALGQNISCKAQIHDLNALQEMLDYCEEHHKEEHDNTYNFTYSVAIYFSDGTQTPIVNESPISISASSLDEAVSNLLSQNGNGQTRQKFVKKKLVSGTQYVFYSYIDYIPGEVTYKCEEEEKYLHTYNHCGGHFYLQLEVGVSDLSSGTTHDLFYIDDHSQSINGGTYTFAQFYGEDWNGMTEGVGRWRTIEEPGVGSSSSPLSKDSDYLQLAQLLNQCSPSEQLGLTDKDNAGSLYIARSADYDYTFTGECSSCSESPDIANASANGEVYKRFDIKKVYSGSNDTYDVDAGLEGNHIKGCSTLNDDLSWEIRKNLMEILDSKNNAQYTYLANTLEAVGNIGYYYGGSCPYPVKYGCYPQGLDCSGFAGWSYIQWFYNIYHLNALKEPEKYPGALQGGRLNLGRPATASWQTTVQTNRYFIPVNGEVEPGDVLLHTNGGTNHTAIYLGYMTLDVSGYENYTGEKTGYWIIQEGGNKEHVNIYCYDSMTKLRNYFNAASRFRYWDALNNM